LEEELEEVGEGDGVGDVELAHFSCADGDCLQQHVLEIIGFSHAELYLRLFFMD
jgi:hypothetical protein